MANPKINPDNFDPKKQVKEYKRTCNQCGKTWHSLAPREEQIKKDVGCNACIQALSACGGNTGAAVQSKRNVESQQDLYDKLHKCPSCGSGDYTEEEITYEKRE